MKTNFDTVLLEEVKLFLDKLEEKPRDKVLYNI